MLKLNSHQFNELGKLVKRADNLLSARKFAADYRVKVDDVGVTVDVPSAIVLAGIHEQLAVAIAGIEAMGVEFDHPDLAAALPKPPPVVVAPLAVKAKKVETAPEVVKP